MRTIDSSIVAQLEAEELRPFYLLSIDIDGTVYRYTDCDVPIYLSNVYSPLGFKFNSVDYSTDNIVDSLTIEIDNVDQVQTVLFVGGTPQGGDVILSQVVLDSSYEIVGGSSITLFEGELDSWEIDGERLKLTATSIFYQWSQNTTNRHSASCRWKVFNSSTLGTSGIECASTAGSTWCDRTYSRCAVLNNTTNFGGFRWLPSIIDKDIWWGRRPKNQ